MSASETPRTDALVAMMRENKDNFYRSLSRVERFTCFIAMEGHARQLERALTAAQSELADEREMLNDYRKHMHEVELALEGGKGSYADQIRGLQSKLREVEKDAAAYNFLLQCMHLSDKDYICTDIQYDGDPDNEPSIGDYDDCIKRTGKTDIDAAIVECAAKIEG